MHPDADTPASPDTDIPAHTTPPVARDPSKPAMPNPADSWLRAQAWLPGYRMNFFGDRNLFT
jgi:hypothetical protein